MHQRFFCPQLALAAWLLAFTASAINLQRFNGPFVLPAESNLPPETAVIAESLDIAGRAEDDVFLLATGAGSLRQPAGAGNINLLGEFGNDVWAWGRRINLNGIVHDHARMGGFSIAIQGQVRGNALLAANNIHLARTGILAGDAQLFGENVICEGAVTGRLTIVAGKATLAGHCGGDVTVKAQDLVILPEAAINGNLDYWAPQAVTLPDQAAVKGKFRRHKPPTAKPVNKIMAGLPMTIWGYLSSLFAGLLFVLCCPLTAAGAGLNARHLPGRSALAGLIWMAGAPGLAILLMLSIVGLPAGLLLAVFTVILIYLGKIVMALALGLLLLRPARPLNRRALIARIALGLGIVQIAAFPVSPFMIWLIAAVLGAGALLRTIFGGARPAGGGNVQPPAA